MSTPPSVHRDLAWALKQQARRVGASAPSVRGSDWRLAIVTAVGADGTIAVDGIPAVRCMESYSQPSVGDVAVITQASSGAWLAWGRTAAYSQGWTTLTLASGFQNPGHGYVPAYLREGRRIWLRGRIGAVGGGALPIGPSSPLLTLPAGIRPADGVAMSWAVAAPQITTHPAVTRVEITTTGLLHMSHGSSVTPVPTWLGLDGITYTI